MNDATRRPSAARPSGDRQRHGPALERGRTGKVKVEVSAGGVVFKRTPKGVRVAFIMDPYGKWTFAKGHPEKDESLEDAALRETREEMGLGRLKIIAPLGKIDIWFRDRYRPETRGMLIHKYISYFLMEAPPRAKGQPQKKERIRRIIWVPIHKAASTAGYKDIQPFVVRMRQHLSPNRDRRLNGPHRP